MIIPPQRFRVVVGWVLVLVLILLTGCNRNNRKNLILTGKVNYKGQPVTGGTLTLLPTDGKTPKANTQISGDGTYSIVPPTLGEMKVAIETETIRGQTGGGAYAHLPKGEKQPDIDTSKRPKYVQIPSKYANPNTSKLSITINPGKNDQNFDLTD